MTASSSAKNLDVRQSGRVIDGHVDELPADAADWMPSIADDTMAGAPNAAELLDVEMHELAEVAYS